ncbi:MAG: hypothetical protein LBE13_18780, partial [Bacteroidales bacterium]|nr:hypothetical protein [Bacteroidales bacterium]
GIPFVKASNGTTVFGEINEEQAEAMGTKVAAPIKLSEGNSQYGEEHLSHRLSQLNQNGYETVISFVEDISNNYDEIRTGNIYIDENGNEKETFLLVKNGEKGSVLFVELSPNNGYYDVNSGGVFNNRYINKRELLWSGGTHQTQPSGETADVSIGQSKINPSESPGAPLSQNNPPSERKDTKKSNTKEKNIPLSNEVPHIPLTLYKNEFKGDFLNDYDFLAEGSEYTVYRSKDGETVIKISEPYNDKSESTFNYRVQNVMEIDKLLGDGSIRLIGYYESQTAQESDI